ncbi:magnesium transporter CorA family protein [Bosea sp. (in: a-proteobacteria)]|uniref:Magnesium transporter CorA family protein n=1 Tax=Bosea vestrisii TaxID=151416 RepID=A0ABW0HG54_9HYPH|nr:magnesium transporter CorA family protein [Bosea sp. (in: a-proteobacteria)]MBA4223245.1 magnesium transporter [Methylobacterium sp.]MBR3192906.1 magnesium transporter CorA family protein [Bosea sp. (in: a-proteobacteria)]
MLLIHGICQTSGDKLAHRTLAADEEIPPGSIWIDLLNPTPAEDAKVERHLGISIPTKEEMHDLEPSEIIYAENGAHYMTSRIICHSDTNVPRLADVTFILTEKALVTVRYDEPGAFSIFLNRVTKPGGCELEPAGVIEGLVEAVVDRAAEVLRGVGDRIDMRSRQIFDGDSANVEQGRVYQAVVRKIGQYEHIISNVRESMVSIERVLLYLSANFKRTKKAASGFNPEWRSAIRDVQAIEEHATFLSNKLQFMLNATLGLVSIEQNKIIKLFSVVAVALMPPTLVASSYGMNFKNMPELEWSYGYPMALAMMVVFAVLPYIFFRWKKWL